MTTEFKTDKGTFILVKVAKDAYQFEVSQHSLTDIELIYQVPIDEKSQGKDDGGCVTFLEKYNHNASYKIIGLVNDLTEEQKEEVTPMVYDGTKDEAVGNAPIYECFDNTGMVCANASDSFKSLLNSLEVYSKNPHGDEPQTHPIEYYKSKYCPNGAENEYRFDWGQHSKWEKAQERTGTWLLLKKES